MKHVTYAQKSLLVGDDVADLLLEYAALLANEGSADTVQVQAFGTDGGEVTATFMLSDGIDIMAETTTSPLPEPDNSEVLAYLRERVGHVADSANSPRPVASDEGDFASLDD